jgi:hypothetical protein
MQLIEVRSYDLFLTKEIFYCIFAKLVTVQPCRMGDVHQQKCSRFEMYAKYNLLSPFLRRDPWRETKSCISPEGI